jgi:hypothetical protein
MGLASLAVSTYFAGALWESPNIARRDYRPKRSRKRRKQPELTCGRIATILPKIKGPWPLDRLKEPDIQPVRRENHA